jgi:hypothetical protein
MASHPRKQVRFTNKNEVRRFCKGDYPNNYVTNPERYTVMLGEMANANREVERNMNSLNVRRITRKRANKWSKRTAKKKANKLAAELQPKKKSAKKKAKKTLRKYSIHLH